MKQSLLTRIFPPPEALIFSSMSLDISDQSIKFAELKQTVGGLKLKRFGTIPVPPGIMSAGKIQDSKKLIALLSDIKQKQKIHYVRVALPEEQLYLFNIRIPQADVKELRNMVELQLEEHIPIKASEAVFDYAILDDHNDGYDLEVSAMSAFVVETYSSVFQQAGLVPLSFELEAQAIARAIVRRGDNATYMIVDFGETRTGISIVTKNVVVFATTLDLGGYGLTKAIEKSLNISFEKAEALKRAEGLSRSPEHKELFGAMLQSISVLRDEISKNLIYWQTHKDDEGKDRPKIDEILFCGGNANLIGLSEYLSASLRMKVSLANPWVNIANGDSYVPQMTSREAIGYVTALGLALGDFEYD